MSSKGGFATFLGKHKKGAEDAAPLPQNKNTSVCSAVGIVFSPFCCVMLDLVFLGIFAAVYMHMSCVLAVCALITLLA